MTDLETFIAAVQRRSDLPDDVRQTAAQLTSVETHSFDQSYIDFLDTQIRLNSRGPSWTERLSKRRVGLLPFRGQTLLRSVIRVGRDWQLLAVPGWEISRSAPVIRLPAWVRGIDST